MKPKASLKSLKMKVRAIASRPCVSVHPDKSFRAHVRASADSRSTMVASRHILNLILTPTGSRGIHATIGRARPLNGLAKPSGNHDADVTPRRQEICYNSGDKRTGKLKFSL